MEIIREADQMRDWTLHHRSANRSVGLVPTMGALHAGHISLVDASVQRCDVTTASIFVNPTQFGPDEDLDRYPRSLDRDLDLLRDAGTDAVFLPEAAEMYPDGFSTFVDPPQVGATLEGEYRPIHFRGVATIVTKLFLAAPVTHAFFGRKDYQQWKVIEAMARDLNMGIEIVPCEIIRESDGLAMSSRNQYLSETDRIRGLRLSMALHQVSQAIDAGVRNVAELEARMRKPLLSADSEGNPGVDKIDYAVIVDRDTLEPIEELTGTAVALIAAWVGQTRLLDNRLIEVHG